MTPPLAMLFGSDGPMEWIVIGLAVLLLFGSQRLPDTMRTLGRLSAKLNRARDEFRKEFQKAIEPPDDTPSMPAAVNHEDGGQKSEVSELRPPTSDPAATNSASLLHNSNERHGVCPSIVENKPFSPSSGGSGSSPTVLAEVMQKAPPTERAG